MKLEGGLMGSALVAALALPALAAGLQTFRGDVPVNGFDAFDSAVVMVLAQDTAGQGIFTGKGLCHVCHGPAGKGTPLAPDLTDDEWLNIDGSIEAITKVITDGVTTPKQFPAPMSPRGGAQLTDAEVQAVAGYVFRLSRPGN